MRVEAVDRSEVEDPVDPAARLDIVPEPAVPPGPRRSRARAAFSLLCALVTHGGFAALFLLLLHWRDIEPTPEKAIPVEVVSQMPGASGSGTGPGAGGQDSGEAKPDRPAPEAAANKGVPKPDAPARPTPDSAPKPAADAAPPLTDSKPKTPPPAMVEPPPEAARAATQQTEPKQANTAPDLPKPAEPTAAPPPPPQAPQVLSSPMGDVAVPAAAPVDPQAVDKPAPSASAQQERDNAAQLAAALPMDVFSTLPPSFRAVLSGGGQVPTDDYKGVVFGKLGRAQGAMEEAKARHLHGVVVVSFSVDDKGQVVDLKVLHSSGTPAVDALALQIIREAAPFPPPPPKSQRVFTPALLVGDG